MHLHTHALVEAKSSIIPFPYIQSDVVAAYRPCIVTHKLIQSLSDVLATSSFIYTDVVNIERLNILQQPMAPDLTDLTESMSQHFSFIIYEDRLILISEDCLKVLLTIFGSVSLEQIRADAMMHGIYLIKEFYQPLNVFFFSSSNHCSTIVSSKLSPNLKIIAKVVIISKKFVYLQKLFLKMQMKIVILDGYTANPGDLSWSDLEQLGQLTVYDRTRPEETVARAADADVVLTNKVVMGRQEIAQLPRLQYIGVLATGYNVVDIQAARERGIIVTNVPAYSTESVAQMVFAHLLTVTNRTEHYAVLNRQGRWSSNPDFSYWDTPLHELAGKTFGIVGLGNIGSRVAQIALAFGMKVVALTSKSALPAGIQKVSLDELLTASDVVSLHCPLTDTTRHLINARTLQMMKPSAILINTGRGPLVNDADVAEALSTQRLYAYCADVLTTEPPQADNPLLCQSNAYFTPHIAWASVEARVRLLQTAIANVRAFANGTPQNTV